MIRDLRARLLAAEVIHVAPERRAERARQIAGALREMDRVSQPREWTNEEFEAECAAILAKLNELAASGVVE
jgi:hypothetical protein